MPSIDLSSLVQALALPDIPIPRLAGENAARVPASPERAATTADDIALSPSGTQALITTAVATAERQSGSLLGAVQALASQPVDAVPSTIGRLAGEIGTAAKDLGATIQLLTSATVTTAVETAAPRAGPIATTPIAPYHTPPSASLNKSTTDGQSTADKPTVAVGKTPAVTPPETPAPLTPNHAPTAARALDRVLPIPAMASPYAPVPPGHALAGQASADAPAPATAPAPMLTIVRPALERAAVALDAASAVLSQADVIARHVPPAAHAAPSTNVMARAEPTALADTSPVVRSPDLVWCQAQITSALLHVGQALRRTVPIDDAARSSVLARLFKPDTPGNVSPTLVVLILCGVGAVAVSGMDFTMARVIAAFGLAAAGAWWLLRRAKRPHQVTLRLRP